MKFTPIGAWSDYPRLTIDQFIQKFPNVEAQENEGRDEDEDEDGFRGRFENSSIIFIVGDVSITRKQLDELEEEYTLTLAVDGNLSIDGFPSKILYVSGDLHANSIYFHKGWLQHPVGGRIVVRDCVWISAEDNSDTRTAPTVKLETPFLFSWFYNIDNIDLPPETVIFILADWDYCTRLDLPNPIFSWHDAVFVLDDRFVRNVDCASVDEKPWDQEGIEDALENGENVFLEGFDIACMAYQEEAKEAMALKDYHRAYLLSKKSATLSPAYYEAWLAMADALREGGAYEQALQLYLQAIFCFPSRQTGLINTAANYAALSAIRCRDLPAAITLATISIDHTQEGSYNRDRLALGYRFRAEAYLLSDRDGDALKDLKSALSYNKLHGTANWLMGLLYYRKKDLKRAANYHQIAAELDHHFTTYYDKAGSTDFLACKPVRVDWDTQSIESTVTANKDEAYWTDYMRRNDPLMIKRVPVEFRTPTFCMEVLRNSGLDGFSPFVQYFPVSAFTRAMAENLVACSPDYLEFIPPLLIDKSLCMLATPGKLGFKIKYVPLEQIDYHVCVRAVQCGENIDKLPAEFIDKALCLTAIKFNTSIKYIPSEFIDDDLYLAAIAYDSHSDFRDDIPARYKTPAMLKRSLSMYKQALDTIPGHLFDKDLYQHAAQLYGQGEDWPAIVARHDQEYCRQNESYACSEVCWTVFWDEPFILEQIAKETGYHLTIEDIPENLCTQKIADACFKRDMILLDLMPKRFVNLAMCERFSRSYPDMLDHVPVAFRTASMCLKAVTKKASNLALVPLALRNVELCVMAIREGEDMESAVPTAIYYEVFDKLIKKHSKNFMLGWLYSQRGGGALMSGGLRNIEKALSDYHVILNATDTAEFSEYRVEEANYMVGYCHYLRGDFNTAEQWHAKVEDWPPYHEMCFIGPTEPADFEKRQFDQLMLELEELVRISDYQKAYSIVQRTEQMLADSGNVDVHLWSDVLDKKRVISYELKLWDVNETSCRDAIERLESENLWSFLVSDTDIRQTLRACYYRLGTLRIDEELSLDEMQYDLDQIKKAFALIGKTEDKTMLHHFHEGRVALLLKMRKLDKAYQDECDRALEQIKVLHLLEKGFVKTKSVLEALE